VRLLIPRESKDDCVQQNTQHYESFKPLRISDFYTKSPEAVILRLILYQSFGLGIIAKDLYLQPVLLIGLKQVVEYQVLFLSVECFTNNTDK
jgi:hypothetical protein